MQLWLKLALDKENDKYPLDIAGQGPGLPV